MMTKPLFQIADELSIYHYCDTTIEEVERILNVLQTFEPAGIGARSLQECLLIQCNRKKTHGNSGNIAVLKKIIEKDWDNISHNRWETIRQKHNLSEQKTEALKLELRKLNPRPGNAMGEKASSPEMYIIPDVCITVDDNGNIELTLNDGDVPTLTISEDTKEMMDITFVQDYVRRGNLFIGAIMQRRNTILRTMQAILKLQRKYFLSGDKRLLKPMSMEDISKITHQDLSTISRVCNNKFVETPYGTKPLRWFFTTAAKTSNENLSIRNLHQALRDIVEGEDKKKPFSDDALVDLLKQQGYDVARRTVAKYREHLGIPTSRMRRK
jgi:RNA polymerase sigma-54 factor